MNPGTLIFIVGAGCLFIGGYYGYKFPRDVEIASTAPVVITYEVPPDAVRSLVLKGVKGCPVDPNAS